MLRSHAHACVVPSRPPTATTRPTPQVIENAGLCVTLYEIVSVEGGTIFQGEGDAHFVVKFKLVSLSPQRAHARL